MSQDNKKEDTKACPQDSEDVETAETAGAGQEAAEPAGDGMAGEPGAEDRQDGGAQQNGRPQKKDPKDEQIEELQDRLKRQMAEFDNFRKRTEKEKSAMYEIGARDIIEKILPVLDNFERGLAVMPQGEKSTAFAEGVEKIYKQFVKTLEDAGVEAIEAVGQQFDPNLHNAVMHVEDEKYGENEISMEMQKGYKYRGTVVRHSMVQVAN